MSKNSEETRELIAKIRKLKEANTPSGKIDWEVVRRRMAESVAKLNESAELTEEELHAAWARRAAQVATNIEDQDMGQMLEVAVIRLDMEHYGLDVAHVFDIRALEQVTRVPRVPDWVAGVVNLRGRVISVLDLRRYLGLPASTHAEEMSKRHIVVVESGEMELALLADEVLAIQPIPVAHIQEASGAVRGIRSEYVRGVVVRSEDGSETLHFTHADKDSNLLIILDLPVLLADKRLIVHEEVL